MKKFVVLGILFILPITAYLFFALGTNNFKPLPVLTYNVSELDNFKTIEGEPVRLKDHITVLGFFGNDPLSNQAYTFNLAHKIFTKNQQFDDFQFVILLSEGNEERAKELQLKLGEIVNVENWKFAFGSSEAIKNVFDSLKSNYSLDSNYATPYVFIIDKNMDLRGRDDDEDTGVLYGFNASNVAEINNKMSDDIKVLLAEYRLELKKYKTKR